MNVFKRILRKLYLTKARKAELTEFAELLKHVKNVAKPEDCRAAFLKVSEFVAKLDREDPVRHTCGDIIEYLSDTVYHAERGYHKPRHNGWNTVRVYPNINDYVNIGIKI